MSWCIFQVLRESHFPEVHKEGPTTQGRRSESRTDQNTDEEDTTIRNGNRNVDRPLDQNLHKKDVLQFMWSPDLMPTEVIICSWKVFYTVPSKIHSVEGLGVENTYQKGFWLQWTLFRVTFPCLRIKSERENKEGRMFFFFLCTKKRLEWFSRTGFPYFWSSYGLSWPLVNTDSDLKVMKRESV